jgi:hypothetical protein
MMTKIKYRAAARFAALLIFLSPLWAMAQKKDRYYEKVKEEIRDLQIIFDFIIKENLHEGFTKKTIWLRDKVFNKDKLIRKHFNKLHIKEVVIQGKTGYKTIAPEDSVIILKRKYYSPISPRHEIIYYAGQSGKIHPDVQNENISFLALTTRMYYLKR